MTLGAGMVGPAALASAMSSVRDHAGSAAGLYGFAQMAMCALGTLVVGLGDVPARSCALTQILLCVVSVGGFRYAAGRLRAAQAA